MHNYFSQKKTDKQNLIKNDQQKRYNLYMKAKKQKDEKMIDKFIRRTKLSLYKQVQNKSTHIQKYVDPKYEPRKSKPQLRLGPPSFYFQERSSKQRVNNAIKRHINLDSVPFHKRSPTSHRFRQTAEGAPFKFTFYDTASRVTQNIRNQHTNQLETSWNLNVKKYNEKLQRKNISSYSAQKNMQSRKILPSLNIKHHPKTIESVNNNLNFRTVRENILQEINSSANTQPISHNTSLHKQNTQKPKLLRKNISNNVKFSTVHVYNHQ